MRASLGNYLSMCVARTRFVHRCVRPVWWFRPLRPISVSFTRVGEVLSLRYFRRTILQASFASQIDISVVESSPIGSNQIFAHGPWFSSSLERSFPISRIAETSPSAKLNLGDSSPPTPPPTASPLETAPAAADHRAPSRRPRRSTATRSSCARAGIPQGAASAPQPGCAARW